jgi:hypothetical protein
MKRSWSAPRFAALLAFLCSSIVALATAGPAHAQVIQTVAGTTDITHRPARTISVRPWNIAAAPDGTLVVADSEHAQVLRFDPVSATFTAVAGTGVGGFSGDGGPATNARLNYAVSVAYDAAGNLFIADVGNGRIRKVSAATGEMSTVAGGGWSEAEGVPPLEATLRGPWAVTVGADGSIYIVEQDANRVRRIAPGTGLITTIAGSGTYGFAGDGGPAQSAQLARPSDVALDGAGNLYIADQSNHCIRVVDHATGIISRYAGTGQEDWNPVDGVPAIDAALSRPTTLRFDSLGNLLFNDQGTGRVRKVDAGTGILTTIAGGGWQEDDGGPALYGRIDMPQGLALASNGDLYVTSLNSYIIQRISAADGTLQTVAGNGFAHFSGDGAAATLAQVSPDDPVADPAGNISFLDNMRIRTVNAGSGLITTVAGPGSWGDPADGGPAANAFFSYPTALARDAQGNLFIAEQGNLRIRKIDAATGLIHHYAGVGYGYGGDGGPASSATMRMIRDMATDAAGNLYIVEEGGPRVRRIDAATGIITTIAGNGAISGPLNDGSPATQVALYYPATVAVDSAGSVYISERGRIRKIDAITGIITSVAGNGTYQDTGDGGPATNAGISADDLVVDSAGNIFIASGFSYRVRKIDAATGIITTVAGTGEAGSSGDGGLAVNATLDWPRALALTSSGDLLIAESARVRRVVGIAAAAPAGQVSPPVITSHVSGPQGNMGWFIGNVTVTWSVTDPESDITSSTGCAATTVTADTSGTTFSCTATSEGGTSTSSVTVRRDTTLPTLYFFPPSPGPNSGAGWNNSNVYIQFATSDAHSGVASASLPSPVAFSAEGGNQTRTVRVTDNAGNYRDVTTPAINIDKTGPSLTFGTPSPAANAAGWNKTDVTIPYTVTDTLSGPASSGGQVNVIGQGTNVRYNVTVTDNASNASGFTTVAVNIDKSVPTASVTAPLNGATYAVGAIVNASYSCSDADSGVNTCAGTVPSGTAIDTSTAGAKTFSVAITDRAGNVGAKSITYNVGTSSPPPPPPPPSTPTYCSVRGQVSGYEWIQSVRIGSTTYTSNNNGGYGDFTANPFSVVRGANSLALTAGGGYSEQWRVWIDLNGDGTFASTELLYSGSGSGTRTGTLSIPSSVTSGSKRMRVSMAFGSAPSPCSSFTYGEVEDYSVLIP